MTAAPAPADTIERPTAPDPAPAPGSAPGPLSRILTPVEPARPVQPLGSTAAMSQTGEQAAPAGKGATATTGPSKTADRDSAVGALVRALATRLGRTGTTTKRTHQVTETRVSGATSTRAAKNDGQHRTSRDAKLADLDSKTSQRPSSHAPGSRTADTKAPGKQSAPEPRDRNPGKDTGTSSTRPAKDGTPAKAPGDTKPGSTEPSSTPPAKTADPKSLNSKTRTAAPKDTTADGPKKPKITAPEPIPAPDPPKPKRLRTQPAREAGYRDGTRVATVAGHAKAYRDGALDGWDDRMAQDQAEAKRMDEARTRSAIRPKEAPKMKPASGSTADLEKKPAPAAPAEPVQVTAVGEKAVGFTGADGTSHTMSRGEVRTLKGFERTMGDKRIRLGNIRDGSKITSRLAVDMARRAKALAEDAKSIQGGPMLVGVLNRLAERAQTLRNRAEEIEKSAHLGSEAVAVLVANAETRHGGIYRAVIDSPLTLPAERAFYLDTDGT